MVHRDDRGDASSQSPADKLTLALDAVASGESGSATMLLSLLYEELRLLARARMRKLPSGNTIEPTALVHEAFMRVKKSHDGDWNGRKHFFGAAARAMRDILVEQARRKSRIKHGGQHERAAVDPDEFGAMLQEPVEDVLALHEALEKLEQQDARKAQVVMLRYFSGLEHADIAEVLDVSERTVERDWRFAKAWLKDEMAGG